MSKRLFRCFAFVLLAAPGVILLVGCNRGPAVAQVSGKVLYKDGSVPKGGVRIVRFEPSDDSPAEIRRPAGGAIADDGTFVLSTRKPGDGIYLGKYAVTFTVIKAPREQISLIKPEYTRAASTPYHVTIDGDRDDLMFEIEPLQ